ncbi:YibE/F family protein [Macrococcus caseolyticus]|uniref:YibE/F family protein n=1 Tax=Macrococcoides caseolyticum TaxID=69966 RepID=UPI002DBCBBCE|nr:YibE/F family protein [Macrococcus caseolyticus]MEB8170443.1 YibE/F family protein [Macrococcus caseolyticus]
MKTLTLLIIILFVLMAIVGRKNGIKAFLAIFMNIFMLAFAILCVVLNANVIFVALCFSIIMGLFNILIINKYDNVSISALISTFITFIISLIFIYGATKFGMIQGFPMEDGEEIATYSLRIGVSFFNVMLFVIMISALGAIIDLSVSIASSMEYIYLNEPHLTRSELYRSGLNVAKDILCTTTNTLYFAYLGTGLTLIIWFKNVGYSFEEIINSKVFSQEILMIISGGVAVAIAIPVTCVTASYIIYHQLIERSM